MNAKQTINISLKEGKKHTSRVDLKTLCDMVLMMAVKLVRSHKTRQDGGKRVSGVGKATL